MAYDEKLAERIRTSLKRKRNISERKMFGGVAFMASGNMFCGVVGEELMVRVGPDAYEEALRGNAVREMDFTGRPMRGMIYVGKAGIKTDAKLSEWIEKGLRFAKSLPPK